MILRGGVRTMAEGRNGAPAKNVISCKLFSGTLIDILT